MMSTYRSRWGSRILLVPIAVACALVCIAGSNVRGDEKNQEQELASPQLATLEKFLGPWRVTEVHFDAKGEVIATVSGTEEVAWILDRHAIRRRYTTTNASTVYRAIATLTFSDAENAYVGFWFDNVSTSGPSSVRGEWDDKAKAMVFTFDKPGKGGNATRYQIVDRFLDEKTRIVTTHLIDGAELVKRMEVRYHRAVPCPAGPRLIMDK